MEDSKLSFKIGMLNNLMKRQIDNTESKKCLDKLTRTHGFVIGFLKHNRGKKDIFQRDIEKAFSIRRSTVTGIVKLMEQNGLIIRRSVEDDARLKKLELTEKALKIDEAFMNDIEEFEKKLTNGISDRELIEFIKILDKMKQNIE